MSELLDQIVKIKKWWVGAGIEEPCKGCIKKGIRSEHCRDEWVIHDSSRGSRKECMSCKTTYKIPYLGLCDNLLMSVFRAYGIVDLEKALELYEKYYQIKLQKESHKVQLKILKTLNELGEIQKKLSEKLSEKPSSFILNPINTQSPDKKSLDEKYYDLIADDSN